MVFCWVYLSLRSVFWLNQKLLFVVFSGRFCTDSEVRRITKKTRTEASTVASCFPCRPSSWIEQRCELWLSTEAGPPPARPRSRGLAPPVEIPKLTRAQGYENRCDFGARQGWNGASSRGLVSHHTRAGTGNLAGWRVVHSATVARVDVRVFGDEEGARGVFQCSAAAVLGTDWSNAERRSEGR